MISPATLAREKRFDWPLCHESEAYVLRQVHAFQQKNPTAAVFSRRLAEETGNQLLDWIDHLILSPAEEQRVRAAGYTEDPSVATPDGLRCFWHPEAMLPRLLLAAQAHGRHGPRHPGVAPECLALAVRCDSISDFLVAHGLEREPEGAPLTRYRQAMVSESNGTRFCAVERHGYAGFVPAASTEGASQLLEATELWRTRRRVFAEDGDGFRAAHELLDRLVALAGRDLACHAVFAVEREFWQRRNRAARVQKARQDRLGLGWANHDHHTFRSSRPHFVDLMKALEKLGFERRERYYAGAQAGWGAQILEQPVEGLTAFCDVDLEQGETEIDFSRQVLPAGRKLGTIGLWVGLHGESFLDAGLHHLECRFDYQLLRDQLAGEGVSTMQPFSDFEFLKQAFTEGERWTVSPHRVERLLALGLINEEQSRTFLTGGAIGSHLENLQRKGGFKGFNQKSVSVIIQATDPRLQPAH